MPQLFKKITKIHVGSETESGSETNLKVGSGSEKNHSGSTTAKVVEYLSGSDTSSPTRPKPNNWGYGTKTVT
jgi:hypothetical protein